MIAVAVEDEVGAQGLHGASCLPELRERTGKRSFALPPQPDQTPGARRALRPAGAGRTPAWIHCGAQGRPAPTAAAIDMSHSVRQHLRLDIAEYDQTIRRWIPGYERMLEVAAQAVADVNPETVVDLGAGTGGLSEAILEHEEVGAVVMLDVDPEMMEQGRTRLARFGDRARPTLRSFDEPFESCDAFAASLSLHHIPTIERKAALFRRAFEALRPGGVLVNADCCMPDDARERQALFEHWARHQVANGIPEEQAWAHFEEWAGEDTYLPLADELAALQEAGFEAERVWNDGPIGVVVARKPAD